MSEGPGTAVRAHTLPAVPGPSLASGQMSESWGEAAGFIALGAAFSSNQQVWEGWGDTEGRPRRGRSDPPLTLDTHRVN